MKCKICKSEMDIAGFQEENCNGWLCPKCGHKEYDVASMKIAGEWWPLKNQKGGEKKNEP